MEVARPFLLRPENEAIVKLAWIRACVKAGLPNDPNYPDQQKCKSIKRMEIVC